MITDEAHKAYIAGFNDAGMRFSLNGIAKASYETARKRQENGANISVKARDMLKHCATEVVEAMEAYTNLDNSIVYDSDYKSDCKNRFASELADIICCAAIIAHAEEIDLDKAMSDCLKKNRLRAEGKGDKK
jgi:penicillin V acylase-like amidase (Ntn superfamily)